MAYKSFNSSSLGLTTNNAGGLSYKCSKWDQLLRFLTIGSESGTYYVSSKRLTTNNATNLVELLREDPARVVNEIVRVSDEGLAAKNDHAIFALAIASTVTSLAYPAVSKVCRTGRHLMQFMDFACKLRGTGRGLRRAVGNWFLNKKSLPLQAIKYRQRDGWTLRDLLRLSHPKTDDASKKAVFEWICRGTPTEALPDQIKAFEEAKNASEDRLVELITEHSLPWEAVPTEHLRSVKVWEALTKNIGTTALIRNLGRLSSIGFPMQTVVDQLRDENAIRKDRIHPINVLIAQRTYLQGHGEKGKMSWTPDKDVVNALETAFYTAFKNVDLIDQRLLVAVDVSGSMHCPVNGVPNLQAIDLGAALAVYFKRTASNVTTLSFDTGARPVPVNLETPLTQSIQIFRKFGGGTDVTAPINWAVSNKEVFDAIILITDSETWANRYSSRECLDVYRKIAPNVKLICLSTTATDVDTVDSNDRNQFGTAGFDASVPTLVGNFLNS